MTCVGCDTRLKLLHRPLGAHAMTKKLSVAAPRKWTAPQRLQGVHRARNIANEGTPSNQRRVYPALYILRDCTVSADLTDAIVTHPSEPLIKIMP